MYAVCVYWPFHFSGEVGLIAGGLAFLANVIGGLKRPAQPSAG